MQRALRNHLSSHQLSLAHINQKEPCAFCCSLGCRLTVQGKKIRTNTIARPNCKTYSSILPFTHKFFKVVSGFPSSNQPYFCSTCKVFIWSYNIFEYYDSMHPDQKQLERSNYYDCLPSTAETKEIQQLFPINTSTND